MRESVFGFIMALVFVVFCFMIAGLGFRYSDEDVRSGKIFERDGKLYKCEVVK